MTKVSKSPDRHTFQRDGYIKRCEEKGKEPDPNVINMYKTWLEQDEANMTNPEWQNNNMEYDLLSTSWILAKVRASNVYAQNLYAAMCNMQFVKNDVWPVLKDQRWSCSWRHAGGIIADMQEKGDYIDWYCSGIGSAEAGYGLGHSSGEGYVPEGTVTDEVRIDLLALGWIPTEWADQD
jgi:hypothetical protein